MIAVIDAIFGHIAITTPLDYFTRMLPIIHKLLLKELRTNGKF